jgi:signal transduction histidine kinase
MLHEFITLNRDEIIRRCRDNVARRPIPAPSELEINHGVPMFLDQLVGALRTGGTGWPEIDSSAGKHGHDLLLQGFTVSQVVHDYGDVCQTITKLAAEANWPISTDDFGTLNRCLDDAIAGAVTMYQRERGEADLSDAAKIDSERLGFLVHELRNLVNTAIVAFEVLRTGNVGFGGSVGAVLNRSLMGLRDLIAGSIDVVNLATKVKNRARILVSDFIAELGAAATLEANVRGVKLIVTPVPEGLAIEADRQVLTAVVGNLLQNAFKFTRPRTTVTLRVVGARTDRVLIEVEDECGGLPGGSDATDMYPSFEQRGADRTGMGIGLSFSRWGAEANGGRLYTRNMPGNGCVFVVDLPKSAVPSAALVSST